MYPLHTLQWYPNLAIVTPCKLISDMSAPHSPAVPQSCNSYTLQVYEQCIRSPLSSGTTILQYLHLAGLWAVCPLHIYLVVHNLAIFTPCRFMSDVSAPHSPPAVPQSCNIYTLQVHKPCIRSTFTSGTTILQSLHLAGLWAMFPLYILMWYHNHAIFTPCRSMSDVSAPHSTGVPPSRNIYTLQVHEPCIGSKFNSGNTILQHLHLAGLRAMLPLYSNRTIIMQYLHLAGLRAMYPPHTY